MVKAGLFRSLFLFVVSALCAPAAGAYYPVEGFEVPWVNPSDETVCTASHGSIKAKLTVSKDMFEGGRYDNVKGKLEYFINSRKCSQEENFNSLRDLRGPFVNQDSQKRMEILLDLSVPPDQNKKSGYYSYRYSSAKMKFVSVGEKEEQSTFYDTAAEISCTRKSQSGNTSAVLSWKEKISNKKDWMLTIKKNDLLILNEQVSLPEIAGLESQTDLISCAGPFITSLDGSGEQQVLIRICAVMRDELTSYSGTFDKIYYYDKQSKKIKEETYFWGCSYPRFARLKNDGKVQLVGEDYMLERDCWNKREFSEKGFIWGGPLQIWEWKNQKLQNTTRNYPDELKKHAKALLDDCKPTTEHPFSNYYVAYAGDLCLLGEREKGLSELKRLATADMKKRRKEIIQALMKRGYYGQSNPKHGSVMIPAQLCR